MPPNYVDFWQHFFFHRLKLKLLGPLATTAGPHRYFNFVLDNLVIMVRQRHRFVRLQCNVLLNYKLIDVSVVNTHVVNRTGLIMEHV
jgi:hypothetical protein